MNNELLSSDIRTVTAQNIIFQNEFSILASLCEQEHISLVALKGISFFDRIYNSSERSLTDIDILIPKEQLPKLQNLLVKHNYSERIEEKWSANNYKHIYYKFELGLEIVIEVHTQLIANPSLDNWNFIPFKNFKILAPTDEILYLCYHYAHQHTLLKAKWLHDIFLIYKKNPQLWNTELWKKAKQKKIHTALLFSTEALKIKYNLNISTPSSLKSIIASYLLNRDFIENPDRYLIKYYVTKHAVKDSQREALFYNWRWLYFFIKKRLKRNLNDQRQVAE